MKLSGIPHATNFSKFPKSVSFFLGVTFFFYCIFCSEIRLSGQTLTDDIAKLIETRDPIASNLRTAFLSVIGKRIQDIEDG